MEFLNRAVHKTPSICHGNLKMPADLSDIDHNQWTGKDILDNFQKELQIVYLIAFFHMWTHKLWHRPNAIEKHLNFRCLTQKPVNPCQGWDYTMGCVCIGRYFVVFTPNLTVCTLMHVSKTTLQFYSYLPICILPYIVFLRWKAFG